jgi:hypothetical protein
MYVCMYVCVHECMYAREEKAVAYLRKVIGFNSVGTRRYT